MENLLIELEKFLNFEDETILNFYHHDVIARLIKMVFQKFSKNLNFDGGEGGI